MRVLTNQEFWLRGGSWWHLLPGLLEIGLFAGAALLDLGWRRGVRSEALPDHFSTKGAAATWLDGLAAPLAYLGYALLLGYGLATPRAYRRYRHYLDDNFSETERLRFAGLRQVLIVLLAGLALSLLHTGLEAVFGHFDYDAAWYAFVVRGGLIYALAVVGLQANYAATTSPLRFEPAAAVLAPLAAETTSAKLAALSQPAAPSALPLPVGAGTGGGAEVALTPARTIDGAALGPLGVAEGGRETGGKAAPTAPPLAAASSPAAALPADLLALREQLLTLMDAAQPYLEPELTLAELARRLRTSSAVLSKVINTGCGQNFNDFVNTYRVAEARRRLADPRRAHYSLLGVALESGFNSKSTFNRMFKKLAGLAPGEVVRPKS